MVGSFTVAVVDLALSAVSVSPGTAAASAVKTWPPGAVGVQAKLNVVDAPARSVTV